MSPSRIPRPGAPPSPSGPSAAGTASPTIVSRPNGSGSGNSPALGTIVHGAVGVGVGGGNGKANPFAQLHNKRLRTNGSPVQSIKATLAPQSQSQGTGTGTVRRRPKPPVAEGEDSTLLFTPPINSTLRRTVPINGNGNDGIGIGNPRTMRAASGPTTTTIGVGGGGGAGGQAQGHRSILRQPSTPSFTTTDREKDKAKEKGVHTAPSLGVIRAWAASTSTTGTIIPIHTTTTTTTTGGGIRSLPSLHLFEPCFIDSRQPAVPPHIADRLKLIRQLGVVLGVDGQSISKKIDIPCLLARIDKAYERDRSGPGTTAMAEDAASAAENKLVERTAVVAAKQATGSGGGGGGGGVFGMFRRLARKNEDSERSIQQNQTHTLTHTTPAQEGPAFGVPLSEAPEGSWCTSLIGGQRHDLPLVVFTVVEEIYRRGMSQPGIFRLAGDGQRISALTKIFNLSPLYGDSLPITNEPIHNLTGLVKRYVRDLPEPILDDCLFEAFLEFCVDGDSITKANDATVEPDGQNQSNSLQSDAERKDDASTIATTTDGSNGIPGTNSTSSLSVRIHAAQILLKLLPPLQFSLFIYLLAFLGQLPLFPDNRLNVESISIIFGPAMCAARGKGISGLGNKSSSSMSPHDDKQGREEEKISELVEKSQMILGWLLRHWASISENVLDIEDDILTPTSPSSSESLRSLNRFINPNASTGTSADGTSKKRKDKDKPNPIDPRLLSPIDLRQNGRKNDSTTTVSTPTPSSGVSTATTTTKIIHASQVDIDQEMSTPSLSHSRIHSPASTIGHLPTPRTSPTLTNSPSLSSTTVHVPSGKVLRSSVSSGNLRSTSNSTAGAGMRSSSSTSFTTAAGGGGGGMKSSPSAGRLFARAFSSMSISTQAQAQSNALDQREYSGGGGSSKEPKRSTSFTSLSSLVRKVGSSGGGSVKSTNSTMSVAKSSLIERDASSQSNASSATSTSITTVLGSLHDLLVNKDKQIERDARELALLRHTLLEMDEKIKMKSVQLQLQQQQQQEQGARGPVGGCKCNTPEITITSTPSSSTIPTSTSNSWQKEVEELQRQLNTSMKTIEQSNYNQKKQADRILFLENTLAKTKLELSKNHVALALEKARAQGLAEERDLAKERLDKVKTTLFSVA